MPNPVLTIALLLSVTLIIIAWFRPRFAWIPSVLLFLWGWYILWGMTQAIPRGILEHLPAGQSLEYLEGYRDGVKELSERQSGFASPILKITMLAMTLCVAILSLKNRIKAASPSKNDTDS
ncbi:hypothetical protein BH11VER1_BH11VER1_22010 [soil metagenome]